MTGKLFVSKPLTTHRHNSWIIFSNFIYVDFCVCACLFKTNEIGAYAFPIRALQLSILPRRFRSCVDVVSLVALFSCSIYFFSRCVSSCPGVFVLCRRRSRMCFLVRSEARGREVNERWTTHQKREIKKNTSRTFSLLFFTFSIKKKCVPLRRRRCSIFLLCLKLGGYTVVV